MARISGVNIPTNKRVHIALTYIHGLGHASAQQICDDVGIARERRVNDELPIVAQRYKAFVAEGREGP